MDQEGQFMLFWVNAQKESLDCSGPVLSYANVKVCDYKTTFLLFIYRQVCMICKKFRLFH